MNPDVPSDWLLVLCGWSVVVVLWHTTALSLLFGMWRLWHRSKPARDQHRVALRALVIVVALTVATPVALMPTRSGATPAGAAMPTSPALHVESSTPAAVAFTPHSLSRAARLNGVMLWVGLAWQVGFAIAMLRLAGGWSLAVAIRRRAIPVSDRAILDAAEQVSETCGLPPVRLLTSDGVEAPVVIGHRSPAVILPRAVKRTLSPEALCPLLAHELAHVTRQDYLANLTQSSADALLFFSPGARWISGYVRETREYCCDDVAVRYYGRAEYVKALTTLAAEATAPRAHPALAVAGPRLIVRIRRLLEEETVMSFVGYRLVVLAGILVTALLGGSGIVHLSTVGVAAAAMGAQDPSAQSSNVAVPMAYAGQQPGAAVMVRSVVSSPLGLCGIAEVRNAADVAVTGLRFVAVVSSPGTGEPVAIATSEWVEVDVPAFGTASVDVSLMPVSEVRSRMKQARSQVMCGLREIRYANNSTWSMTPNPAATTAEDALGLWRPEVSRALIGASANADPGQTCIDERGGRYSQGAIVPVTLEPGRLARCSQGRWEDYVARPAAAKPLVRLELQFPDGPRPVLKVEPEQMATVSTGGSRWGLVPIVDGADAGHIRIVVYDLASQSRRQLASVSATVGGAAVSSHTDPPFTIRVTASRVE